MTRTPTVLELRHGSSYGVQFHLEADAQLAATWLDIPAYHASLEAALGPDAVDTFLDALRAVEAPTTRWASRLVDRWLGAHLGVPVGTGEATG